MGTSRLHHRLHQANHPSSTRASSRTARRASSTRKVRWLCPLRAALDAQAGRLCGVACAVGTEIDPTRAEFKKIYRQFFPFGDPSQFAEYVFNVGVGGGEGPIRGQPANANPRSGIRRR